MSESDSSSTKQNKVYVSRSNKDDVLYPNKYLVHHTCPVTKIATSWNDPELMVTASKDKTLVAWYMEYNDKKIFTQGQPRKSFVGHAHTVSDVVLSEDAKYALSGSFDNSLRLWDVNSGKCTRKFIGHTADVMSVSFSPDNRMIVSGARDNTIKIWNVLGHCVKTFKGKCDGDINWLSSVKCVQVDEKPAVLSFAWNSLADIWDVETCFQSSSQSAGVGPVVVGDVTPDGALWAAGGKNGTIAVRELDDFDEDSKSILLVHQEPIVALAFSPTDLWLAVAYEKNVKIWDIDSNKPLQNIQLEVKANEEDKLRMAKCSGGLQWSADGMNLFIAYDDNSIRVWSVIEVYGK